MSENHPGLKTASACGIPETRTDERNQHVLSCMTRGSKWLPTGRSESGSLVERRCSLNVSLQRLPDSDFFILLAFGESDSLKRVFNT